MSAKTSKIFFLYPSSSSNDGLEFTRDCAKKILECIDVKKTTILESMGHLTTTSDVIQKLNQESPELFLAFGHGMPDQIIIWENGLPIFKSEHTLHLKGIMCCCLACCTGKELGPKAIEHGATAFFGFKNLFIFSTLYRDDFLECYVSGIIEFILGRCDFNAIHRIVKEKFEEKANYFISIGRRREAGWCLHNKSSSVFLN